MTGVEDSAWEGIKPTGGILTVWSELGEPIHKVAMRAVKLWKEFDDTVFKLPKEKWELWLAGDYWETEQGLRETLVWMEEGW